MTYDSPVLERLGRPRGFALRSITIRLLLLSTLLLLGLLLTPALIAPPQDFIQGPGGAVAYVSLWNQLHEQYPEFWAGEEIHLVMTESEFSGMLSSALLSGRGPSDPLQKVRAGLADGEIWVETVLTLPWPGIPARYRGPVGLRVRLPVSLIRWVGSRIPAGFKGLDLRSATISLPVSDMVAASLGRRLELRKVTAVAGRLTLSLSLAPDILRD